MPTPKSYTKKDGSKSYVVRFRHGGKQTSETFATLRDARTFCADVENHGTDYAVDLRVRGDVHVTSPSLDEVAERFWPWKSKRVRSERTVPDYRRDYQRHVAPHLGRRPIASITQDDVTEWLEALIDDGLSPKTVAARHALLHGIIAFAMSSAGGRMLAADPCLETELPKRRKKQPKGLRPAEWIALEAALRQIDPHAADLSLFLLASGWRWSEAAAVDAWAVDDDGSLVTVTMGRVLRRTSTGGHVIVEDEGKGDASLRRVVLDTEASAMVRRRVAAQGSGLVFTTARGSTWTYSNFYARAWKPAVQLANLSRKPSPHWLRHTAVFWLTGSGANLAQVQSRIGHASIKTTIDVYGSMITDVDTAALTAFAALRRPRPTPLSIEP